MSDCTIFSPSDSELSSDSPSLLSGCVVLSVISSESGANSVVPVLNIVSVPSCTLLISGAFYSLSVPSIAYWLNTMLPPTSPESTEYEAFIDEIKSLSS